MMEANLIIVYMSDYYKEFAHMLENIIAEERNKDRQEEFPYYTALWGYKHYKDNEQTIKSTQKVVFIGISQITKINSYNRAYNNCGGVYVGYNGSRYGVYVYNFTFYNYQKLIDDLSDPSIIPKKYLHYINRQFKDETNIAILCDKDLKLSIREQAAGIYPMTLSASKVMHLFGVIYLLEHCLKQVKRMQREASE